MNAAQRSALLAAQSEVYRQRDQYLRTAVALEEQALEERRRAALLDDQAQVLTEGLQ